MDTVYRISPNERSSKRTKECIHQHGPLFRITKKNRSSEEVYLVSTNNKWFGWLPTNEIEAVKVNKSLNDHEPKPVKNNNPAVWDLVIKDMQERDQIASKKYGTRLQPFNGRNSLIDAYQEVLDLAVYLRQTIFEMTGK